MREVTHPGPVEEVSPRTCSSCVCSLAENRPGGLQLRLCAIETSHIWHGPKTLGLRPISASSSRSTRVVAVGPSQKLPPDARGAQPCATRLPQGLQFVVPAHRANIRARAPAGPVVAHIDRDLASRIGIRRRRAKTEPTQAIAFCLVPLAMTTEFCGHGRCRRGRQNRTPEGTAAFAGLAGPSDVVVRKRA